MAIAQPSGSGHMLVQVGHSMTTQQTQHIEPLLVQCWASGVDGGLTVNQQWLNVSCLLGRSCLRNHVIHTNIPFLLYNRFWCSLLLFRSWCQGCSGATGADSDTLVLKEVILWSLKKFPEMADHSDLPLLSPWCSIHVESNIATWDFVTPSCIFDLTAGQLSIMLIHIYQLDIDRGRFHGDVEPPSVDVKLVFEFYDWTKLDIIKHIDLSMLLWWHIAQSCHCAAPLASCQPAKMCAA